MVQDNYVNFKMHIKWEEVLLLQFHSKSKYESIQNLKPQNPKPKN